MKLFALIGLGLTALTGLAHRMKFFVYAQRLLDPTDSKASLRHAMYGLVMTAGTLYLGMDLANAILRHNAGITSDWNFGFGILVGAVTAGKLGGQKLNNDAATPPQETKE